MARVTKIFTFDSAHRLTNYRGKCKNIHGHTYLLEVTVEGKLDGLGMVMDFGDLKKVVEESIHGKFDHQLILKTGDTYNEKLSKALPEGDNSICWVDYNPTVENMANDIFNILQGRLSGYSARVVKVSLYETPTSRADVEQ